MSFLSDYAEYCSNLEVPPSFTTFSSLVALSSLLRRRVWIYKGDYIRIYPNLYVVLVGPPGCGKNTSIEIAEEVMMLHKVPLSAESVTREKLILDMHDQEGVLAFMKPDDKYRFASPYTILATELSEFLGAGGLGMISFLTDIYSRNIYEYRTKNKGSVFVHGPYLNIIAGTTADWITTYLKDDIISGGFSRRAIFVYETGRIDGDPFPTVTPAMRDAWKRVMARSEAIGKVHGQFEWHPDAVRFMRAWYPTRKKGKDLNLLGYYETKDIQLIKIAMLCALSESDELVLKREHLEAGLRLLGIPESNLNRVFSGIGRNELNQVTVKALDFIMQQPERAVKMDGIEVRLRATPKVRLKSRMWNDANGMDFEQVLNHLKESGQVGTYFETVAETGQQREWVYLKHGL